MNVKRATTHPGVADRHSHPVDPERVELARRNALSDAELARVSGRLRLLAEPTRARIVAALSAGGEVCVGDLALAIDVNENAVSYALRQLREAQIVQPRREGRIVYYRLLDRTAANTVEAARAADTPEHDL